MDMSMEPTKRELEIWKLLAKGWTSKAIAWHLKLSYHTVKIHTHNLYLKINAQNRIQAVVLYIKKYGMPL